MYSMILLNHLNGGILMQYLSEQDIENNLIKVFEDNLSYDTHINAYTADENDLSDGTGRDDKQKVVLKSIALQALKKINDVDEKYLLNVISELESLSMLKDIETLNYEFYSILKDGYEITVTEKNRERKKRVKIIDFNEKTNNNFTIVSQMWIKGRSSWRRPDLLIFINGLPLVFIELKNSTADVFEAFSKNLCTYRKEIPQLFKYNQICMLTNARETQIGAYNSNYENFFSYYKSDESEKIDKNQIKENFLTHIETTSKLLNKNVLIDYIENFILYVNKKKKIIAKNHQYLGVNRAFEQVRDNIFKNNEKLGYFSHTQGSGKSYSMIMLAMKIRRKIANDYSFLVITDREDLHKQIYKNFLRSGFILKEEKVAPGNSKELYNALQNNTTILFSLIHKFRSVDLKHYPRLSQKSNIIVFVDEAHRSQYKELAQNMRNALPNAKFLGFTGTPLLGTNSLTKEWFGECISEYGFDESIEDEATVPLYYVNRAPKFDIDTNEFTDEFLELLDDENLTNKEYDKIFNSKFGLAKLFASDEYIEYISSDIVDHFPNRGFLGKGMVISVDKVTTAKIYLKVQKKWKNRIKELKRKLRRDEISEIERSIIQSTLKYMEDTEMKVIISDGGEDDIKRFKRHNLDFEDFSDIISYVDEDGNDYEEYFKDPNHSFNLAFVCGMWLTGFDVPCVSTLYLAKPLKEHTLMQAITRANRVFPGKNNGLIVDYVNIFTNIERALKIYATSSESMVIKDIDNIKKNFEEGLNFVDQIFERINHDIQSTLELDDVIEKLKNIELLVDGILSNDQLKIEFISAVSTLKSIYNSSYPDIKIRNMKDLYQKYSLYMNIFKTIKQIESKRMEKIDELVVVDEILDDAIRINSTPNDFNESEDYLDLSQLDLKNIKKDLKQTSKRNIVFNNVRSYIEKKVEKMVAVNSSRMDYSIKFNNIVEKFNNNLLKNELIENELIDLLESIKFEAERPKREGLNEFQLAIFDICFNYSKNEEIKEQIKETSKVISYILDNKEENVNYWYMDAQPLGKMKNEIRTVLNDHLPQNTPYDSLEIFNKIIDSVLNRFIVECRGEF